VAAAIGLSLAVAGFGLVRLPAADDTDPYYAVAVQSMLHSWHNFFFLTYDPAGFISVDKPPLGLWLQAASARLLGFGDLALILPQALAGGLSILVLYHLVSRAFGARTALLASLMLAVTPVCMATNRSNAMDSLLVLAVLLAAWAVTFALETRSPAPLLLCAVCMGLAFNLKWMQGFLLLPGFVVLYVLHAPRPWQQRALRLAAALVVLAVVSLSWAVIVDRVPVAQRPQVAASSRDSEVELALGYYGFSRLLSGSAVASSFAGDLGNSSGDAQPLRLLNEQAGGEVGWLLPSALAGVWLAFADLQRRRRGAQRRRNRGATMAAVFTERQQRSLTLWCGWLLVVATVYSSAPYVHPYYLGLLAPPVSALAAIAVLMLWGAYVHSREQRAGLPITLLGTGLVQAAILLESANWNRWLLPLELVIAGGSAIYLAATRIRSLRQQAVAGWVAAAGVAGLLLAPAVWASVPVWHFGNPELPVAGPDLLNPAVQQMSATEAFLAPPSLTRFLLEHDKRERYILATRYGGVASPVMLATGRAVLTYGGYLGSDNMLTVPQMASVVTGGQVRFFWLLAASSGAPAGGAIEGWVREQCSLVPARAWQPAVGYGTSGPQLYDCDKGAEG
jgi:4-amino-4-deoxy-L-arabinose transferase-like glycosyltransferase